MITVHGFSPSGNCHKVRLLLEQLGREYAWIETDSARGATRTSAYLAKNPNGKVPLLELDDGRTLVESNAILCWLGEGTAFVPADPVLRAEMLGWMFWEQNQHEGIVAVRGALMFYPSRRVLATPERMAELLERGHAHLQIIEDRLAGGRDWLVGDAPSLADICLYGYTHTAGSRGGFDMARFPAITRWLARIAALPGYKGLDE